MKNPVCKFFLVVSFIGMLLFNMFGNGAALAEKTGKTADPKAADAAANGELDDIKKTIMELTRKVYMGSLFSPKDNNKLIDLKGKLYDMWLKNPTNRDLAKPFYDTALLYNKREFFDDSKELLKLVIENFPPAEDAPEGTVNIDYSSKAQEMLKKIEKAHPSN